MAWNPRVHGPLAVVLSLVAPGLGHAMAGRLGRGIAWGLVAPVANLILGAGLASGLPLHVAAAPYLLVRLGVPVAAAVDVGLGVTRGRAPERAGCLVAVVFLGARIALLTSVTSLVRGTMVEPFRVPSGGMVPTLLIGDHVLVRKGPFRPPLRRGQVVVFHYPPMPDLTYIKRVVALPGDTVRVEGNRIFLDGEQLPTTYVDHASFVDDRCRDHTTKHFRESLHGATWSVFHNTGVHSSLADYPAARSGEREVTVPEDHLFVMGDNRDNSEDSRKWGFVRQDQVIGVADRIWLSWDGCAEGPDWVRTERYGMRLH